MKKFRRVKERAIEGLLFLCGTITTLSVLLIVLFLFRQGLGLFFEKPVPPGMALVLTADTHIQKLSASRIHRIYQNEYTNWNQLGGSTLPIRHAVLSDLLHNLPSEALHDSLPVRVTRLLHSSSGLLLAIPEIYVPAEYKKMELPLSSISVSEIISPTWAPTSRPVSEFGMLPLLLGTLLVAFGAILLALPVGLAAAIYMAEIANARFRNILKPVIELLAGIPSVVFGFFGLIVVVPAIQKIFHLPVGDSALAGCIILGIMALPTIITISEDALRNTPRSMREASLALGATHWQTIKKVVIPNSLSGIAAASILGIGRAIGETMAVLMVTGNAAIMPHSFLQPVRTIPATIAAELGEAPYGGNHFKALFFLGCILFVITMIINLTVELILKKKRSN